MTELADKAFDIFQKELDANTEEQLKRWRKYVEMHDISKNPPKVLKQQYSSVIIAIFLPKLAGAALSDVLGQFGPEAEVIPVEELHITLIYLGDQDDVSIEQIKKIRETLEDIQYKWFPMKIRLGGVGKFFKENSEGKNAVYAQVDSPDLMAFREYLRYSLDQVITMPPDEHGFAPHVTLAYVPKDVTTFPTFEEKEFAIDVFHLAIGGFKVPFELQGDKRNPKIIVKGGPGSGHHGHQGRPGKRGGSLPGSWGSNTGKERVSRSMEGMSKEEIDEMWADYEEAGPTPVYHGTSEEAAENIMLYGLAANPGSKNIWGQTDDPRPAAVYFSKEMDVAKGYGEGHAFKKGQRFAVVEIDIPDSANPNVKFDAWNEKHFGDKTAFYIEGDIPAEWISKVHIYSFQDGRYLDSHKKIRTIKNPLRD